MGACVVSLTFDFKSWLCHTLMHCILTLRIVCGFESACLTTYIYVCESTWYQQNHACSLVWHLQHTSNRTCAHFKRARAWEFWNKSPFETYHGRRSWTVLLSSGSGLAAFTDCDGRSCSSSGKYVLDADVCMDCEASHQSFKYAQISSTHYKLIVSNPHEFASLACILKCIFYHLWCFLQILWACHQVSSPLPLHIIHEDRLCGSALAGEGSISEWIASFILFKTSCLLETTIERTKLVALTHSWPPTLNISLARGSPSWILFALEYLQVSSTYQGLHLQLAYNFVMSESNPRIPSVRNPEGFWG